MRLVVAVIGKASGPLADAIAHHERRAARYWPLQLVEVRTHSPRGSRGEDVKQREWERLAAAVPSSGRLWVCDERGSTMSSAMFASALREQREEAVDAAFVVGGANGLPQEARDRADIVLALSPWTLSHDLARLVLAEQLYRAGTILRGEPYHK